MQERAAGAGGGSCGCRGECGKETPGVGGPSAGRASCSTAKLEACGCRGLLENIGSQNGVTARPGQSHLLSLVFHPTVLEPYLQENNFSIFQEHYFQEHSFKDAMQNLSFVRTLIVFSGRFSSAASSHRFGLEM